jgi:hypothetical protein
MRELIEAIRDQKVVLFIGSGVSANLGLPTWGELIKYIAKEVGYDPEVFNVLGDVYTLAEFYEIEKKGLGKLRSWMDVTWHDAKIDVSKSRVHKLIVALRCNLIYTTNYDRWLEKAHEAFGSDYVKIVDVSDIPDASTNRVQIVKFHGDFEHDESLVLTESSYFERLNFESPLDIRFRADTLGKTILFLGYSLTDINMRLLLFKLDKLWSDPRHQRFRPKSFIFMARPNHVQELVLAERRHITPIVGKKDNHGEALDEFLTSLVKDAHGTII